LGVAATALSGSLSAILRGSHYFGRITIISLTNTALTAVLALILQLNGRLTLTSALLILGIVPSLVSFAVAYRLLPATLDLRPPTKADWQTELRPLWRFSRWLGLSNILVILTTQMDLILLQRWVVEASLGHYFLALNLVTKLDIVNQSLYTVLVPSAAKLSTAAEFQPYLRRSLKRGLLITALLAPLLIAIRPLIELFYGVEFGPAAALFRWLFGLFVFDVLTLPVILLIFPLQQPKLLAVADASRALIFLGTAVLLMPSYGALGVIIAKGAAKLLSFLLLLLLLRARHVWPIPAQKNAPHI
jgi:PST family polysaccharide transporter